MMKSILLLLAVAIAAGGILYRAEHKGVVVLERVTLQVRHA
ncbi:MAG: hypothetical protein V4641_16325 [Pseudomonadota bacterium]